MQVLRPAFFSRQENLMANKDFNFSDKHFQIVRNIVTAHSGIVLSDIKKDMVYSRLVRRIRASGLTHFDDYCKLLEDQNHEEFTHFINALTTNLTYFFRENHHFELLANQVLPEIMQKNKETKKIRIWSAGCSTGMEPYSIAMVVKEVVPAGWDVKILATDLDTNVIAEAQRGVYTLDKVSGISDKRLKQWCLKGKGENADKMMIKKSLKQLIQYKQLNLLNDFPFSGLIDIIFCRNVVIYFDKETQKVLFNKFTKIHRSIGYLFIGHSETLYNVSNDYKLLGNTLYQKTI